jgi:hypothetical protein
MSVDIDLEKKLRSIEQKVDENSKMLRSIKRKQAWSFWFSVTKILLVLGVFYYAYVFFEPVLLEVTKAYQSIQGLSQDVEAFKGIDIMKLLNQ